VTVFSNPETPQREPALQAAISTEALKVGARMAMNAADPMLLFCCTNLGQMFRSKDGGETWEKLRREFGEISTMLWRPAA
jgi:hypothetical protein